MPAVTAQRLYCIEIRSENSTLFAFFRYRSSKRTTTPHVSRRHTGLPVKLTQKKLQESPIKLGNEPGKIPTDTYKRNAVPNGVDETSGNPITKIRQRDIQLIGDTGSSTSENAFSPQQISKKKTPEAAKILAPIRKSGGARQSAQAGASGNMVPINAIGEVPTSSAKQFSIESPADQIPERRSSHESTPEREPSLKSLISEMGFHEKSLEYKARVRFLEAIKQKSKKGGQQIGSHRFGVFSDSPRKYVTKHYNEILVVMTVQKIPETKY